MPHDVIRKKKKKDHEFLKIKENCFTGKLTGGRFLADWMGS